MQVVAVLAVRNEEAYIANSLRHLIRNEVQYAIVDNASTDATVTIATSAEFRPHLVAIKQIPFNDAFDMTRLLTEKMAMITRIDADWVMHLDADEIPHSYRSGETLRQTISRIDRQGYNAIDFNEFVFLPVDFAYQPNYGAPYQPLQHYYFFEPSAPRLMRAWKKVDGFSMIEAGGHNLEGDDIRLAPETLALRHYIFRENMPTGNMHGEFLQRRTLRADGMAIASPNRSRPFDSPKLIDCRGWQVPMDTISIAAILNYVIIGNGAGSN